jgi:hypothetical protein
MSESYLDRPQDDGTHKAHPAYNRGKISGVVSILDIIRNIVNGIDTGQGENKSPQVEAIRRAVLEYKTTLDESSSKSSDEAIKKAKDLVASAKF